MRLRQEVDLVLSGLKVFSSRKWVYLSTDGELCTDEVDVHFECATTSTPQFSIAFAYVSILCCSFQDMVMVVSSCLPSLHWERHQRLRLRMAIGVVLCEIGDTRGPSLLPCLRVHRYLHLLTVAKLHSCFSPPLLSLVPLGYNFVGSSWRRGPSGQSLSRPRVLLRTSSIGTRPHPGLLATSALSCWAATSVTTRCTSVAGVVRFGHLPVLLFLPLRRTSTFFILCAFLLS